MRMDGQEESSNVEDVRGSTGGRGLKLGIGGTLLALVASYFLGIDPSVILGLTQGGSAGPASRSGTCPGLPDRGPARPPQSWRIRSRATSWTTGCSG